MTESKEGISLLGAKYVPAEDRRPVVVTKVVVFDNAKPKDEWACGRDLERDEAVAFRPSEHPHMDLTRTPHISWRDFQVKLDPFYGDDNKQVA